MITIAQQFHTYMTILQILQIAVWLYMYMEFIIVQEI